MRGRKLYTSEYLSRDMLDEEFLAVFRQFRLFQLMLGSCRVDARYRFVTAPTRNQKLYTTFIVTIIFISYLTFLYHALNRYENYFYKVTSTNAIAHFLFYFCSIIQSRFFLNNENVNFYIKLSQIDKVLKAHYSKVITNVIHRMNWITLFTLFLVICFVIFLFTNKVAMFMVTTFEYVLLAVQSDGPNRLNLVILAILTTTDTFGLLLLCLRCEALERDVKEVKLISIKVMSVYHTGTLRDKAKKIYRAVEDTFPRFSVYDMWELDARLFIRVCNVVTGFFVTLLQFTYL
ncbi:uncharacterized protein LOC132901856 [Amyelois transitella]|uniref:uncharacterized protein LOC132901856 n=1 Tax=Amyelois transitella TaxID=680683 RepID=UPI00298FB771|nr:uncharacterized protein LOC132901856 [Amyelois transitella]